MTGGAVVDGGRETEQKGIFACGNVLHVHDLVDYVSEEAVIAGKAAVKFIRGEANKALDITLVAKNGVRYTVPQRITEAEDTTVYFRVSDVFRDRKVTVRVGDEIIISNKKQKLAPGEMETVTLTKDTIEKIGSGIIEIGLDL